MTARLKISMRELREKKQRNFEERLRFIDLWVDYIKKTPNEVWSAQQKELIDAQVEGISAEYEQFRKLQGSVKNVKKISEKELHKLAHESAKEPSKIFREFGLD